MFWMFLLGFGKDVHLKVQCAVSFLNEIIGIGLSSTRPWGAGKVSEAQDLMGALQDKCKVGMKAAASEFKVQGLTLSFASSY